MMLAHLNLQLSKQPSESNTSGPDGRDTDVSSYENDEKVNSDNTDDEMKRGSDSEKAEATI